jgi:hypothetical protein
MNAYIDRVVLRIRSDTAAATGVQSFVERIIESHAAVTREGGFSNPERDRAPELQSVLSGAPNDLQYRAEASAIDRGAWRVLLQAVRGELLLQGFAEVSDVQCSLITASGDTLSTDAVASLPYPASPAGPPFELSWIVDRPPWRAAVHVSFIQPPEPNVAANVSEFLGDWQRLIRAYPPPFRPEYPVGGALPSDAVWSHPRTVELTLDVYLADEAVFHPIVNYACWLQRRAPIEELVLD